MWKSTAIQKRFQQVVNHNNASNVSII